MACPRCTQAGKEPKVYYYEKGGRWQRLETCQHRTRRLWRDTPLRRKPTLHKDRRKYTQEMDDFIRLHYPKLRRTGRKIVEKVAKAFEDKFGIEMTRGRIYGRYYRLRKNAAKHRQQSSTGVPSLPKLKFMEQV